MEHNTKSILIHFHSWVKSYFDRIGQQIINSYPLELR